MSKPQHNPLVQDLKLLVELLENPEPGLASWHRACADVWKRIKAMAEPK